MFGVGDSMSFYREYIQKPIIDVITGKRSKHWRKTRNAYVKAHPHCAYCGSKKKPQVHHIEDFSTRPELELVWTNLMTLCMHNKCHYSEGHLLSWKSINPDIRKDTADFRLKVANRR